MKIPLHERLERMTRWLAMENERPLVGFSLGSYYPLRRYPGSARRLRDGTVRPEDVVVADYLDDSDRLHALHEEAGGDFVWSAAPFPGIPWVEAALGCGVWADHRAGSTRAMPPEAFRAEAIPTFSESNEWVRKMLEFIPALTERSAGRYPVGVTLMRGIADLLAALYGGEAFVLRMLDAPEEVHAAAGRLTEFWIAFGRCLLERLPRFHGGTGSYFYGLWAPGELMWLQEDAVALLSPALYEEFIYPADCRMAEAFEHTVMHLHPTRPIPVEPLGRSALSAIELHIDHDGPRAAKLEREYRQVLERKPLLIWGDVREEDLEFILRRLPHRGLAVNVMAADAQEAGRLWELAMRWCGR